MPHSPTRRAYISNTPQISTFTHLRLFVASNHNKRFKFRYVRLTSASSCCPDPAPRGTRPMVKWQWAAGVVPYPLYHARIGGREMFVRFAVLGACRRGWRRLE